MTRSDILRHIEEENVKTIRLCFTDIHGVVKNGGISARRIEDTLDNKIMSDGTAFTATLEACDNLQTFKLVVKNVARRHGYHSTFMMKPIETIKGSGMHTNYSLTDKDGNNVFYDPERPLQLSETAIRWIADIIHHARGFTAVTNPYLAMSVILASGLDGISNKMNGTEPVYLNLYELDRETRESMGIKNLPENLKDALKELRKDDIVKNALGRHVLEKFLEAKYDEWNRYRMHVSQWELDAYLHSL